MSQLELNASEVTGRAWELAKKHGLVIAALLLGAGIIASSFSSMGFPWAEYIEAVSEGDTRAVERMAQSMGGYNALSLVSSIVSIVISAGIMKSVLNLTKGSAQQFDFSAFKMPISTYLVYILAQVATSVIIILGSFLCIVPGIYLAVRLMFVGTHILEHPEDDFTQAFKRSWEMTKGNFWNLFVLGLIYVLICIGGVLCCCIGIYFAEAMGLFMMAVAYFTLSANTPQAIGYNNFNSANTVNNGDNYQQKF